MSESQQKHDVFYDQVIQVNNMIPMDQHNKKERLVMTHNKYPKQSSCVGKIIRMKYTDEREQGVIHYRFWMVNYDKNQGWPEKFIVLRWDDEYPYRVILMSSTGVVLVTKDTKMLNLTYPKFYEALEKIPEFPRRKEIVYGEQVTADVLRENSIKEFVHQYPIQDNRYFGATVYTEYKNDITDDTITNKLPGTTFKNWRDYRYQKDNTPVAKHDPDTIYEEIMAGDKSNGVKKPYQLRGFPFFYDRHKKDFVDTPWKAYNKGFIIRADKDSDHGVIVVAETIGNTVRFVTDKEAYFYTKTSWLKPDRLRDQRKIKESILEYKLEGEE